MTVCLGKGTISETKIKAISSNQELKGLVIAARVSPRVSACQQGTSPRPRSPELARAQLPPAKLHYQPLITALPRSEEVNHHHLTSLS